MGRGVRGFNGEAIFIIKGQARRLFEACAGIGTVRAISTKVAEVSYIASLIYPFAFIPLY